MLSSLSLRTKIIMIFSALDVVCIAEIIAVSFYSKKLDILGKNLVDKEFVLFEAAQQMELALSQQKGFLTYYFVDGDAKWLKSLGEYRQVFKQRLDRVLSLEHNDEAQRRALELITTKYDEYIKAKDIAIETYKVKAKDERETISTLHEKQRDVFFELLGLCRTFSQEQGSIIRKAQLASEEHTDKLREFTLLVVVAFAILSILLLYILYQQILGPIRLLAVKAAENSGEEIKNEVDLLKNSLQGMIRDFDETSDELARSRKHLINAERMAMVGELAAGVAHTIRNPFTSIKMRMFSLGRTLDLSGDQEEDIKVISNEIDRIDRILGSFLEFSRPPKLRLEKSSLGGVVKSVLVLMEHRLNTYRVDVVFDYNKHLEMVTIDVDRIKEAIVNIVLNACEAMENGGQIIITETRENDPELGPVAIIAIADNGPGVEGSVINEVTVPFFTTKEDGTGLGLSIVKRVAQEHKGKFIMTSPLNGGTECRLVLPIGETDK